MICLKLQFLSLMWALAPSSPEELCSPRWPWLAEVVKINSSLTNCRLAGTSFCVLRQNPGRPNSPNCPVVRHKSNTVELGDRDAGLNAVNSVGHEFWSVIKILILARLSWTMFDVLKSTAGPGPPLQHFWPRLPSCCSCQVLTSHQWNWAH